MAHGEHTTADGCIRVANESGDEPLLVQQFSCGHSYLLEDRLADMPLGLHMLPVRTEYMDIACTGCFHVEQMAAAEEARKRALRARAVIGRPGSEPTSGESI